MDEEEQTVSVPSTSTHTIVRIRRKRSMEAPMQLSMKRIRMDASPDRNNIAQLDLFASCKNPETTFKELSIPADFLQQLAIPADFLRIVDLDEKLQMLTAETIAAKNAETFSRTEEDELNPLNAFREVNWLIENANQNKNKPSTEKITLNGVPLSCISKSSGTAENADVPEPCEYEYDIYYSRDAQDILKENAFFNSDDKTNGGVQFFWETEPSGVLGDEADSAGTDGDDEDSNGEDYWKNDYPDEEDEESDENDGGEELENHFRRAMDIPNDEEASDTYDDDDWSPRLR